MKEAVPEISLRLASELLQFLTRRFTAAMLVQWSEVPCRAKMGTASSRSRDSSCLKPWKSQRAAVLGNGGAG